MSKSILKRHAAQKGEEYHDPATCKHDFEHPLNPRRAVWLCPKCKTDYSLEYLFYYEAAHPERILK